MKNTPEQLTEQEERRRGQMIVDVLGLRPIAKRNAQADSIYKTEWGTKTALGLFRSLKRVIEDGE